MQTPRTSTKSESTPDERTAARRRVLLELHRKAEEYIDALALEVGLQIDRAEAKALQVALRQDFIEVHNAAIQEAITLPENKNEIDKLVG
jgi:hypothetical protein